MSATEKVKQDLMKYFAAVGAGAGHFFTLRDFNSQVMMNTYAPQERAALDVALLELVDAHILIRQSPTEFMLTASGLTLVRGMRPRQNSAVED